MVPQSVIDEIISRVSIVEVIGRYIDVKRIGNRYTALCPFHNEKTPSFSISEEKGVYHCFGCGASGNTFGFLMQYKKIAFGEALRELAEIARVDLSKFSDQKEFQEFRQKDRIYEVNRDAAVYYHRLLLEGKTPDCESARRYILEKRKITMEMIKRFRLGYGGSQWQGLFDFLRKKGYKEEEIAVASLASKGREGYFDRFKDRIIFPIMDVSDHIVGFGGRILQDGNQTAKYLNTSENPVYHKGNLLFALNFARDEMVKKQEALVVEGYFDVIACTQHGIHNAVAPLGTALTDTQLSILKRYTTNIVFVFDGDEAGMKAAHRAIEMAAPMELNESVVALPGKKDPCDLALELGGIEFRKLLDESKQSPIKFKMTDTAKKIDPSKRKTDYLNQMYSYIAKIPGEVKRLDDLRALAGYLTEDLDAVTADFKRFAGQSEGRGRVVNERPAQDDGSRKINPMHKQEVYCLASLIAKPELISEAMKIVSAEMFFHPEAREIFEFLSANADKNSQELLTFVKEPRVVEETSKLIMEKEKLTPTLDHCYALKRLYLMSELSKLKRLNAEMETRNIDSEKTTIRENWRVIQNLNDQINEIKAFSREN